MEVDEEDRYGQCLCSEACTTTTMLLSWNQTLRKTGKVVREIGWGGSVLCTWMAGALPIGS